MRTQDVLDSAPTHSMTFEEFASHALIACVRLNSDGVLSVVDVDGPGWSGLDKVRMEAARAFSAQGYARATASTLTNRLIRMSLDQDFNDDCKVLRLEPGRSVVLVKEHAVGKIGVKEILRRVYADALSVAEAHGFVAGDRALASGAGAAC